MFNVRGRSIRGSKVFAAILSFGASLSAVAGVGGPYGPPVSPDQSRLLLSEQPEALSSHCFWGEPAGPIDGYNALGIETHVAYWYARLDLPPGSRVVLRGKFPHSRFMSLTTYGTFAGQRGAAIAGYSDYEITPDAGSINPFLPGARRTATNRAYTLTLSSDVDPGAGLRAPNTFYVGRAGETGTTQTVELVLRVYRPDRNRDVSGDAGLPEPTLILADGTAYSGTTACSAANVHSGLDKLSLDGIGVPASTYLKLLNLPRPGPAGLLPALPTHPAVLSPTFVRYFNAPYSTAPFYRGTILESTIASLPTDLRPGLYATPANAYVSTYFDRALGPDASGHNIVVLRGKGPTHPHTFDRDPINDFAGKQVRYWSICNYGSTIANPYLGPVNTACLFDEQLPLDADGYYTIVVSLPEDRPSNATTRCGVAWMDWSTKGDGVPGGHEKLINLTIRQLLADGSFAQAFDKILTPGTERQVAAEYLPEATYMTPGQFEARGCSPAQANVGAR
jgi:hypothetical protein